MRTNIVIDDELMAKAIKISGYKTKKETVEAALNLYVRIKGQSQIRQSRGNIAWEGDLDQMRRDE